MLTVSILIVLYLISARAFSDFNSAARAFIRRYVFRMGASCLSAHLHEYLDRTQLDRANQSLRTRGAGGSDSENED